MLNVLVFDRLENNSHIWAQCLPSCKNSGQFLSNISSSPPHMVNLKSTFSKTPSITGQSHIAYQNIST